MSVYACSDLHGVYELWAQIRDFCKPEDTIYFLGDAADRGSDGVKIIKELLDDPRVVYIKGNHEQIMENFFKNPCPENLRFWTDNGGNPTQRALMELPEDDLNKILNQIEFLPYCAQYKNVFMSHSGFYSNPALKRSWDKNLSLEDRNHIGHPLVIDENVKYIVHGHTPVQYVCSKLNKEYIADAASPLLYDGNKIDIDLCSMVSGAAALINLDTLESKIFKIQK